MASSNTRRNEDAREDDLYTTPDWAVHAILKREPMVGSICDAGYGTGNITRALMYKGLSRKMITGVDRYLHALDVDVICDFLTYDRKFCNVITNPPYKLFTPFVLKAIELSADKTLVFARINALETLKRYQDIYKDTPPNRIYLFANRVNCLKGDEPGLHSSAVFYCWLVWDKHANVGKTTVEWIEEKAS